MRRQNPCGRWAQHLTCLLDDEIFQLPIAIGNLDQESTNKSYFTDKTYKENTARCKLKNLFIWFYEFGFTGVALDTSSQESDRTLSPHPRQKLDSCLACVRHFPPSTWQFVGEMKNIPKITPTPPRPPNAFAFILPPCSLHLCKQSGRVYYWCITGVTGA